MPKRSLTNRTIEVILLESDKHLGEKFEIVRVKPIYARNVLLPKNIAVLATADMVNKYSQKMESAKKEREKRAAGFQGLLQNIEKDGGLVFTGKVNKDANLYAKIDASNIAELIKSVYSVDVEEHFFKMKKKITTIGDYVVPFIYKDIKGDISVKVLAENPEDIEKKSKAKHTETVEAEEKVEDKKEDKKSEDIKEEESEEKKVEKTMAD
ncbi:MAG TPA: 50S ribosomal protein L9 [Candidatus Absconditabacterales bacterium]|nr:50S ribosomal protein L9 [Candidatus Absconditabacterales bacterium]HPK28144.1 50S ribosomal protein L9 [Candidatus Absconditabacterales bacterium]